MTASKRKAKASAAARKKAKGRRKQVLPGPAGMKYVDIQKIWRKAGPVYRSEEARRIWLGEMEAYRLASFESWSAIQGSERSFPPFVNNLLPKQYDSMDWRYHRRGARPGYWDYVCSGACHWTVNLNLFVAMKVQPDLPWCIVTSSKHSTVWDGQKSIWDASFLAMGVPVAEAWKMASVMGRALQPGKFRLHVLPDGLPHAVVQFINGSPERVSSTLVW